MTSINVKGKEYDMKKLMQDWELARQVSDLMSKSDDKTITERHAALKAAGYDSRFMLGLTRQAMAKIMAQLIVGDDQAKKMLFGLPERVAKALAERPCELKRRQRDEERGMCARYIYASLLEETNPNGGQGYLVFRMPRSNKCIVCILEWQEGRGSF